MNLAQPAQPTHPLHEAYYKRSCEILECAWTSNVEVITQLGPVLGASIAEGGVIHTFGSGHSDLIAREVIGRAGGLACVSGIIDPTEGFVENVRGYGTKLVEKYDRQFHMRRGEIMVVVSNSGRNESPIDVALYAQRKGMIVVAVTSVAMSREASSLHPCGLRLYEVADHVLDNGGIAGDAVIDVRASSGDNGDRVRVGPTSTLVGCSLVNWLILAAVEWLRANGKLVPVLKSQNLAGAIDHNRSVALPYEGRLSRVLA